MSDLVTPSATVGPYFQMRLPWPDGPYVVPAGTPGAITIFGRLWDGDRSGHAEQCNQCVPTCIDTAM